MYGEVYLEQMLTLRLPSYIVAKFKIPVLKMEFVQIPQILFGYASIAMFTI